MSGLKANPNGSLMCTGTHALSVECCCTAQDCSTDCDVCSAHGVATISGFNALSISAIANGLQFDIYRWDENNVSPWGNCRWVDHESSEENWGDVILIYCISKMWKIGSTAYNFASDYGGVGPGGVDNINGCPVDSFPVIDVDELYTGVVDIVWD